MNPELTENLISIQRELIVAGAKNAALRLEIVTRQVDILPFDALYRLVAPEQAISELEEQELKRGRTISILRNLFILLPLLVTWLSLGFAALSYQQEIRNNP